LYKHQSGLDALTVQAQPGVAVRLIAALPPFAVNSLLPAGAGATLYVHAPHAGETPIPPTTNTMIAANADRKNLMSVLLCQQLMPFESVARRKSTDGLPPASVQF
jgi:hypothetical protein